MLTEGNTTTSPGRPQEGLSAHLQRKMLQSIEIKNEQTGEFDLIVNWMEEDFPDPGPYPVFFSALNQVGRHVRITVPRKEQESGLEYYALGEIYLFRQGQNGRIGDNMAMWKPTVIEVSDAFPMPSVWDAGYLNDGRTSFGLPLEEKRVAPEDLLITFEEESPRSDDIQFTLDLGQECHVGPVDFWPAMAA